MPEATNPYRLHVRATNKHDLMATSPNIQLLLEGCRRGNRASQLKLYEHFYSYGLSVTLRYSKHREQALEVLNDGFLKAFLKMNQYDSDLPFKPWLRRILINAAIDYHRKYSRLEETVENLNTPRFEPTDYNYALDNLEFDDLIKILQQLTPGYRLVFSLFVIEGLSHQDIAEKLEITIGTSKSNLAKARMKLQSILQSRYSIHYKKERNGRT